MWRVEVTITALMPELRRCRRSLCAPVGEREVAFCHSIQIYVRRAIIDVWALAELSPCATISSAIKVGVLPAFMALSQHLRLRKQSATLSKRLLVCIRAHELELGGIAHSWLCFGN